MRIDQDDLEDGRVLEELHDYSLKKYDLVRRYITKFTTGMKNVWDYRVYIDLFSGPGIGKIAGTGEIMISSPLIALDMRDPFDKYFFCELDRKKAKALGHRILKFFPNADGKILQGDSNKAKEGIAREIRSLLSKGKVLSFCLVDIYKMQNLEFETITFFAENLHLDFLILIPHMEGNRNPDYYMKKDVLDKFSGNPGWRDKWKEFPKGKGDFGRFVYRLFAEEMAILGFTTGKSGPEIIKNKKNSPIYYLSLFSRHDLGKHFWDETKKYSDPQTRIPFDKEL